MIFGHDLWMLCRRFCLLGWDIDEDPERISISKTFRIRCVEKCSPTFSPKPLGEVKESKKHIVKFREDDLIRKLVY